MGLAAHFMPTLGTSEAILLGSAQLHSFPIIDERLCTIKMEVLSLLSAILIHGRNTLPQRQMPILRLCVAEYQAAIMRRRWSDIISIG